MNVSPETTPISTAYRILSHFWLQELKPADIETIRALPELAQTLLQAEAAALTDLAVEYQRLFGFNLPPYESVFIDPSAMLMAPATQRVERLYRQGAWDPPPDVRAGAPDHLGLELLALADGLDAGQTEWVARLQTQHLALWTPVFVLTLQRLRPHAFYARLGDFTLDLILATLPGDPISPEADPFPDLPPPPLYRGTDEALFAATTPPDEPQETRPGLGEVLKGFLRPREAGLFLTREDIARISQRLDLPGMMGERLRMLENLFRLAGQYELIPALFDQLGQVVAETRRAYQGLAAEYPAWATYAAAWGNRLATTQSRFEELKLAIVDENPSGRVSSMEKL